MAKTSQKDLLARFQELGEEALQKLSDVPGGSRLVDAANQTKARLDEMQKRIRGLEKLERRVKQLEQQVAALSKTSAARKTPAPRKPATPKKPPA
jgi:phage I-like protein